MEDRPRQRVALRAALQSRGFTVLEAATGNQGLDLALDEDPDVILLDLGLPDLDGLEVCRRLTSQLPTPIIVVSAEGDEARTLQAFELGVVDYVRKPFSTPVLMARIRVALRGIVERPPDAASRLVRSGDVEADLLARQARRVGGPALDQLTGRQFDLLVLFLRNEGRLLTQDQIQSQLWDASGPDRSTSLRNLVSSLRRSLLDAGVAASIVTETGLGYRWNVPDPPEA